MNPAIFLQSTVEQVGNALRLLPITKADRAAFESLIQRAQEAEIDSYFEFALASRTAITSEMWAIYMLAFVHNWDLAAPDVAMTLPGRRQKYTVGGAPAANTLLDAAADALAGAAMVVGEIQIDAATEEEVIILDPAHREGYMRAFYALAKAVEQFGDSDIAYKLATAAIDPGLEHGNLREEVLQYAIALATRANRAHHIAICRVELAAAVVAAADTDPERMLEAFDSFEMAFEQLTAAPQRFREIAALRLVGLAEGRDSLKIFLPPLYSFIPLKQRPDEIQQLLGPNSWPERISTEPLHAWRDENGATRTAQHWEMNFDLVRLPLLPKPQDVGATIDWTSWMVDHPRYQRAIPHNRSFLREAGFDGLLLVLTHEITHVLSLIGGIGNALNCLRVAAFDAELTMWSVTPEASETMLLERIPEEGVAPLRDGDSASLFRAEQAIDLTLKAQMLQDIWTAWFEGLAVFGETAADPSLDRFRFGPVTNALRNFVDAQWSDSWSAAQMSQMPKEQIVAEITRFFAEFENRCSAAMIKRGPSRLWAYLDETGVPYLAGYIAVRSIVSAWRETTQRPLTGNEAFSLLLHATRFATFDAVPDLSLRSDLFVEAATEMMCEWVARLTLLTREEIEDFLAPPPPDELPDYSYSWRAHHLVKRVIDSKTPPKTASADSRRCLREALASLSRPEDDVRVAHSNEFTRGLLRACAQTLRENLEAPASERHIARLVGMVGRLGLLGSLLPIGRTAARFFLNLDATAPGGVLATLLLTTEEHVEDGKPSINRLEISIDRTSGERIASTYRRLRDPRIDVSRVIDLGAVFTPDSDLNGTHLLAFNYGTWFDIRGPTSVVEEILMQDGEQRTKLRDLVRARLHPTSIERAEIAMIARGDRGAMRTRDWIARSDSWVIADHIVDVKDWTQHIGVLTERILGGDERRARQRDAARSLITTLFKDASMANSLTDMNFATLTEQAKGRREEIVDALFKTAQQPSAEPAIGYAASVLSAPGLRIYSMGAHGWDVCAALRPAT
jgi:hypothetical protein